MCIIPLSRYAIVDLTSECLGCFSSIAVLGLIVYYILNICVDLSIECVPRCRVAELNKGENFYFCLGESYKEWLRMPVSEALSH